MRFIQKSENRLPYWESDPYEAEFRIQYGKTISDITSDLLLGNVRRIYLYECEEWRADTASRVRWNQLMIEAFDNFYNIHGDAGNCIFIESTQGGSSVGILFDKRNRHMALYKATDDLTTRLRFGLSESDYLLIIQ